MSPKEVSEVSEIVEKKEYLNKRKPKNKPGG